TDKQREYEFGKETADPNHVYARQVGKAAVFTVPRLVYDKFATPDLRDRTIFRFDPAQVTEIRFRGWGKSGFETILQFEKNKDGVWVIKSPPTPATYMLDPNKVNAFLTTLSKTPVKSILPSKDQLPEHGFADPKHFLEISLTMAKGP